MAITHLTGHVLDVLKTLPDESVHCCITSPPYWGLRKYDIPDVIFDEPGGCEHEWGEVAPRRARHPEDVKDQESKQATNLGSNCELPNTKLCSRCSAWRGQLGLEPTPALFIKHIVEVFREVRRVLRKDGVMFLNLGDSYVSSSMRNEPSCGISYKVPEDCPLHGSIWNRPCDGCQAVSVLRNFHKGQFPSDGDDPNQGHKESENGHSPTLDFLSQKQTPRSSASKRDRKQKQALEVEPLPVSQNSKFQPSFSEFSGSVSNQHHEHHEGKSVLESDSFSVYAQEFSRKKVYNNDKETNPSSSVARKHSNYNACPYLNYTIPFQNVKAKDLVGIPWLIAFALREDGWYLRSDIIWSKLNPMPESVTDRPTKAHEYIFLFAKSQKYFWDQEAVRSPLKEITLERYKYGWNGVDDDKSGGARTGSAYKKMKKGLTMGEAMGTSGRNIRTVWTIATQPYSEAHFATFPEKLIEPMIRAGTSEKGCCPKCGSPWERVVKVTGKQVTEAMKIAGCNANGEYHGQEKKNYEVSKAQKPSETKRRILEAMSQVKESSWQPTCECGLDPIPCTVLDPFRGSGTVARVATRLRRDCIGIDLGYDELSEKRLKNTQVELL